MNRTLSSIALFSITSISLPSLASAEQPELLSTNTHAAILHRYLASFDKEHGGWTKDEKRIESLAIEYAMIEGERGADELAVMAQKTLLKNLALIDRVWGGAYDASIATKKDQPWRSPDHRKSSAVQADELRLYVQASSLWGAREYMDAARSIQAYIETFLTSPEGAFYAGQSGEPIVDMEEDAYFRLNDAERRKRGVPAIDRRILARENGLLITALARLYEATGDQHAIDRAVRAAEWIVAHRKLPGGGFMSGDERAKTPRLADSIAMTQATIELYASTGDEKWLAEAEDVAFFIGRTFAADQGHGYTAKLVDPESGDDVEAAKDMDDNVAVARSMNILRYYTGQDVYRKMAEHAMRFLADCDSSNAGVLIAEDELMKKPMQVIIVGDRNDPKAQKLYRAALAHPSMYRVLEWAEPGPAPFRYAELDYPRPDRAAAIACEDGDCTPPAFKATDVLASLRQLSHQ